MYPKTIMATKNERISAIIVVRPISRARGGGGGGGGEWVLLTHARAPNDTSCSFAEWIVAGARYRQ